MGVWPRGSWTYVMTVETIGCGLPVVKWWVEPYEDFEGSAGWIVMYERDDQTRYSYGAMYRSAQEALTAGSALFGVEPDYLLTTKAMGIMGATS